MIKLGWNVGIGFGFRDNRGIRDVIFCFKYFGLK